MRLKTQTKINTVKLIFNPYILGRIDTLLVKMREGLIESQDYSQFVFIVSMSERNQ